MLHGSPLAIDEPVSAASDKVGMIESPPAATESVPAASRSAPTRADLDSNGNFNAKWGTISAVGDGTISGNHDQKHDSGVPYAIDNPDQHIYADPNGAAGNSDWFDTWYANWQGQSLEDPWWRFEAGGEINSYGTTDIQPFDPELATSPDDHSNIFQNIGASAIRCPDFDYETWSARAVYTF